jgi:hypothetical protein
MTNQPRPLPYGAFKQFQESYPRALAITANIYGFTEEELYKRVKGDSKKWQNLKMCVKSVCLSVYAHATTTRIQALLQSTAGGALNQEQKAMREALSAQIRTHGTLSGLVNIARQCYPSEYTGGLFANLITRRGKST